MILIDSIFVNESGGKVLLDYLVENLENNKMEVHYLFDDRIKNNHPEILTNQVTYLKSGLYRRYEFYKKNKSRFSKVLCFGNLPPYIKMETEVFTYFHQPMYLNVSKEFSLIERLKFKLKIIILTQIAQNTNLWLVQTDLIKQKLHYKFHFNSESIKVIPFYPQFEQLESISIREKNTYLYPSNASSHKNHKRLINGFCEFYDKNKVGKLILTVSEYYTDVLKLIENKLSMNYPIENIGFVDRLTLQRKYLSSEFLIFPSLAESFGLGLIEAVECGCKVIGSDLPYTYEVCTPTLVFNPIEEDSIIGAFENSLIGENLKLSMPVIQNNINQIISLLK